MFCRHGNEHFISSPMVIGDFISVAVLRTVLNFYSSFVNKPQGIGYKFPSRVIKVREFRKSRE